MALKGAKEQKPHERGIPLVSLQECSADGFKKLRVVSAGRQLFELLTSRIAVLARFVLGNGAVQLFLIVEVPKNDGFIHPRLIRKIAGRGSSKSFLREQIHGCSQDVLPSILLHK